jgi:hypothetical protein
MLEFLLASDGVVDVLEGLEVDESGDLVAGGEAARYLFAMLSYAFRQAVGYADVENVRAIGEDVDPELVFASWHYGSPVSGCGPIGETQIPFGNDKTKGTMNKGNDEQKMLLLSLVAVVELGHFGAFA